MHPSSAATSNPNYSCPPISTLRRASRPSHIPLPVLDHPSTHTDPVNYSAPLYYLKPAHLHPPSSGPFIPQLSYPTHFPNPHPTNMSHPPLTALPISNQDHLSHYSHPSAHFSPTPRTCPLPNSFNHHPGFFQFPPSTTSQSSTPPHVSLPRVDDSSRQSWSNSILNPLMMKRMNETNQSMHLDDQDDPSASIDALVADEQSNSSEMIDDPRGEPINSSNSNPSAGAISPYLRSTSHVLTTPPNPLASEDHPDHQNFHQTFTPIPSAGFEIPAGRDSKSNAVFTFDDPTPMKYSYAEEKRTISLMHDENSNHSSSNSSTREMKAASGTGKHPCTYPECTKVFANKSALAKHKLTHSQDRKHKCPKCQKGFKRLDHLSGHMLTHAEEKPHKCRVPNCNRNYCDARSLKRHIENTHQEILAEIYEHAQDQYKSYLPESAVVKVKDATTNNDVSTDSIDGTSPRSFPDATRTTTLYTYDEEKCVPCQICGKTFRSSAALNGHMRLHGGFAEANVKPAPVDPVKKTKREPAVKRKRHPSPLMTNIKLEAASNSPSTSVNHQPRAGMNLDVRKPKLVLQGTNNIPLSLTISPEQLRQILQNATSSISATPPPVPSPPKRQSTEIVPTIKQEEKEEAIVDLKIPTPAKSDTSSTSSSSSDQTFTFDPPAKVASPRKEPTPSPFIYPTPSQFRRQASLNAASQLSSNPLPTTPYTPPPMLSPFRRGPGLYYRVFSHPGSAEVEGPTVPTPSSDETTEAKINIGPEYQAIIPRLGTDYYASVREDELLFSPYDLPHLDEGSLEKFESLHRETPSLFSPRQTPQVYSLELVYMLLYEYKGDLSRTIRTLLQGTATDIPLCRPLHRYHFLESDRWTPQEIEAFAKGLHNSEKNFDCVSRAVGTKTTKQCIEFYYMPKISVNARRINGKGISSILTRRKRSELLKSKEQQKRSFIDEDNSSSPFNELRIDDDNTSDSLLVNQYICDREDCGQTFTSDRAWRAHRKEHAPSPTTKTVKFR